MAATLAANPRSAEFTGSSPHPCLARLVEDNEARLQFTTLFSRQKHWLLREHVLRGGNALIPGTGYLELARAGFDHKRSGAPIELRDVTFLKPFAVDTLPRELTLVVDFKSSDDPMGEFAFISDSQASPHVTGRVGFAEPEALEMLDLAAVRARCTKHEVRVDGFLPQSFMDFGPRWANVESIAYGDGEALVSLRLPDDYTAELADYRLHPALMDMATGGAQRLIVGFDPERDFFVPLAYQRVSILAPLPQQVVSHIRYRPSQRSEVAMFDVLVCDTTGRPLVAINGFTMTRLAAGFDMTNTSTPEADVVTDALRFGMTNAEGVEAFMRILQSGVTGQVLASSIDIATWRAVTDERARPKVAAKREVRNSQGKRVSRSGVTSRFIAPRDGIERELADMWCELLGLSEVSVRDDFFDLGGQSLVAVRIFNRIRKRYGVSLPLSTLFEAPNIEGCALIIAGELGITAEAEELAPASHRGRSSRPPPPMPNSIHRTQPRRTGRELWSAVVVMQPKGEHPPFFCAAGMGGDLGELRNLAILTGDRRPFYGLQPPGADDTNNLMYSVEELADYYLREIKAIQPEGPYLLGGYSAGGIVSFEMSRRLTQNGERVGLLALIDSYSPTLPRRSFGERSRIHFRRLANEGPRYIAGTLGRRAIYIKDNVVRLGTRALKGFQSDRLRYRHVQDAWMLAQDAYDPPPWDGQATLFRAREVFRWITSGTSLIDDEYHGWSRYITGGIDVQPCPGDHSSMCREPNVQVLAAKLREALDHAVADSGTRPLPSESVAGGAMPRQDAAMRERDP